ncbi:homoserine kinase [Variovorax sp. NFACC27]|uniref:homoserine kinase n=1 Tax=unclassified Variovorax TaxID=663243 RepID=UPI0008958F90|nr:homoserine kinase [Variovorax sp. NFACC28]SEG96408.1 homoserine kinase [Variovorax sp. NFACC29]SFD84338.1 homoserine kinase [Variovorax sp. NFACC26]SFG95979.1 homoserine kinase [Variovorax sp. NFACC27]
MAVFTEVGFGEADALVQSLGLGPLRELRGIEGGIENTNYFATTESGEFVLTLFERLSAEQLPYYLCLMKHLAGAGLPVPAPVATPTPDAPEKPRKGQQPPVPAEAACDLLHVVAGKPAAVVQKLSGRSELAPGAAHCAELGAMLARMHLAGRDYPRIQPNLRGLPWWNETVPVVLPYIEESQANLLRAELAYQNHVAESSAYAALPRGPVHADMFRDNVMFATDGDAGDAPRLTGVFDFYFAGTDTWLFDLAVCLNDWAIDLPTGRHDPERADALLSAYESVRTLNAAERALLPAMLRAAALRFWISRLWDFHLPREASMLKPHDPTHFERVLRDRATHPHAMAQALEPLLAA